MLERLQAGIRNRTLILNLPESAKTAKEDMEYILPELVQVVENLKHMIRVTYLGHSGFLVETQDMYFLFDYYKGEFPRFDKDKKMLGVRKPCPL